MEFDSEYNAYLDAMNAEREDSLMREYMDNLERDYAMVQAADEAADADAISYGS